MAENQVAALAVEGKKLKVSQGNSDQGKWECDTAIAKLIFLVKMLKPKSEEDDSDLILTWYERKGLAAALDDVIDHLHSVWSEVLSPVSKYVEESKGAGHE